MSDEEKEMIMGQLDSLKLQIDEIKEKAAEL
jgi:hypothetical protein